MTRPRVAAPQVKLGDGMRHVSMEEAAVALRVSRVTVMRDFSTAKAWLYHELSGGTSDGF